MTTQVARCIGNTRHQVPRSTGKRRPSARTMGVAGIQINQPRKSVPNRRQKGMCIPSIQTLTTTWVPLSRPKNVQKPTMIAHLSQRRFSTPPVLETCVFELIESKEREDCMALGSHESGGHVQT